MKDAFQEQLIQARRYQILDAAATVFAQKGFHPSTIKDIARQAGIADGTIYLYFENKTALLFAIFERMRASVMPDSAFVELAEQDFKGFLRAFLFHPLSVLKSDNASLFRVIMSELLVNAELRELYFQNILHPTLTLAEQQFEHWVAQGLIRPRNIALSVRTLSALILGLLLEHIMGDEVLDEHWDTLADFVADLLLTGLQG